ncbi:MAG: apolipoprotein N-acyltransferase [Marinibacterium sp.]|nr:apolipoprotein N-acyltransferase [Marinibacterium sp.]
MIGPTLADRLGRLPTRPRLGLAVLAGAGAACSLAPLYLTPAMVLGLAIWAALVATAPGWRQGASAGWAGAAGYFAHGLIWIVEPFLVDVARHGWMAPFALLLMAGGLALFWGLAAGLAHVLGRDAPARALILPVTLGAAEMLRAYVFTGFPWAGLPQGWIDTAPIQILSWIGPNGLALWIAVAVCWPVAGLLRGPFWRVAPALLPMAALLMAGWALRPPPDVPYTDTVIRVIQPNARQDLKWHPDHAMGYFNLQLEQSAAGPRPDLIVWPEVAIPWFAEESTSVFELMAERAKGVPIVLGAQRRDGLRYYNALLALDGAGAVQGRYDKHHLVPFGEYMPFGDLLSRIGIHGLAAHQGGSYSAGPGPQLVDLGAAGQALPLICYEAVFPQHLRGTARPDFLLQVTNDAWFGNWSGPYQHLVQARMRAIEAGLPLVRSANTGVSGVFDAWGRPQVTVALNTAGFADAPLPQARPAPPYSRSGDSPVAVLLALLLAGLILRHVRARSRSGVQSGHAD